MEIIQTRERLLEDIAAKAPDVKRTLDEQLADLYAAKAALLLELRLPDQAVKAAETELTTVLGLHDNEHWRAKSARTRLDYCRKLASADNAAQTRIFDLDQAANAAADAQRFSEAVEWAEKLKEIESRVLGVEHSYYANTLGVIGGWLLKAGDTDKAVSYYQQVLLIRKKAFGTDHPDYAKALNNLGYLYSVKGDYPRAESVYQQSLAICKEALREEHSDYAASLNNLAALYYSPAALRPGRAASP